MGALQVLFGSLVGLSLGLTGGGGVFAVPLLVYALRVPAREAVGVSLVTVCATALVGFLERARAGRVEFHTGLLFALAGMLGAPVGTFLADRIPDAALLSLFALLMLFIAARMWRGARQSAHPALRIVEPAAGPTCQRDPEGKLRWNSRCALLLALVGLGAGLLSGLFGVGGGFVIVPALILFSGMGIERAIGTSLMVITLVSAAGATSHLIGGRALTWDVATLFTFGSVAGLFVGSLIAKRMAGPTLQRVFATAMILVATYVIFRTVIV